MKFSKLLSLLLAVTMILTMVSCADPSDGSNPGGTDSGGGENSGEADGTLNVTDDVPAIDFGDEEFSMLTFTEPHADLAHVFDEPSDDAVDNAKYLMILNLEERFNCDIVEYVESESYVNSEYRAMIQAGADDFDMIWAYDRFAHYFAEEGSIYDYDDLLYIDLSKDYWDQSLLEYTSVGDNVYYAYGTCDFTYYDLTHCLVFNKKMIGDFGMENPYELVTSGKWTLDKMHEMSKNATIEMNGDGLWTNADSYGFVSAGKQIPPNFWIAGGTMTVKLDKAGMPYATIKGNELLSNIIDKCFSIFWDDGIWYVSTGMGNQSDSHENIFEDGRALFADYTFFYLNQLKDCEEEFGILPYPKFNADQKDYFSRVEAGTVVATVPITNPEPERAGAIIEAMASIGYKELLPAYYSGALQRRISRDEESSAMLDLIFDTRVYDLGDTWFCDQIRDGFMATLWNTNSNTLASSYASYEKLINKAIYETIQAYMK